MRTLLTVSRLDSRDRYKNIDVLIHAVQELSLQNYDIRLVIVGDGDDYARLSALAFGHDNIEFMGWLDSWTLDRWYEVCDLFVLPSTEEGFGLVFIEAMKHGKPCIGIEGTAVAEIIDDARTGYLVEPNVNSLVLGIKAVLHGNTKTMGEAGRKRYEEKFSYPVFMNRVQELLA